MYLPIELWCIIKEFMFEPKWKIIGRKTYDYSFFLTNKQKDVYKKSFFVSSSSDIWRGAVDLIDQRLLVFVGFSREFLSVLARSLRDNKGLIILDFVFDRNEIFFDNIPLGKFGINKQDKNLRDNDIPLFLYSLTRSKSDIIGFCLDQCQNLKIRELISSLN